MVEFNDGGKGEKNEIVLVRNELGIMAEQNNNIKESLIEIRSQLPYLATTKDLEKAKTDFVRGIQKVVDKHVELYHLHGNTPKINVRSSLVADNKGKIIGALITVIAALVAVIYFLIGQPNPAHQEKTGSNRISNTTTN